jgi:hypothetical protein
MKKILSLSLLLASMLFTATFASAQTYGPQQDRYNQDRNWRNDRNDRYNRRGVRVVTRTRIVRQGWRTYRETIQIRYLPNGRTTTRVISRVRIR